MDDYQSPDMHFPEFSDIYNDEFNLEYFFRENNEKFKENGEKEKNAERELRFPLKSESFSNELSNKNHTDGKLPAFNTIKSTKRIKKHDKSPESLLFKKSSSTFCYNKEREITGENIKSNDETKENENEFSDFLKSSNYNFGKKDEDDEFWDFLKTSLSASGSDCGFGFLSDTELKELLKLSSSITPSSGYESGASCVVEDLPISTVSSTASTLIRNSNFRSTESVNVLCERSSCCTNEKVPNIEESEKNSDNVCKEILNEFEDFVKSQIHRPTSKKIYTDIEPKQNENEVWNNLNPEYLLNSDSNNADVYTEDTFWDFLKTNISDTGEIKPHLGCLSMAELEELRKLESITSSPANVQSSVHKGSHISTASSSVTSIPCSETQVIASDEDISRDLVLAEINKTIGEIQKQDEQEGSLGSKERIFNNDVRNRKGKTYKKSENTTSAIKLTCKNKSYDPKIINQNVPLGIFPPLSGAFTFRKHQSKPLNKNQLKCFQQNLEQYSDSTKHIIKQGNISRSKEVSNTSYTFDNNQSTGMNRNLLKNDSVEVSKSNSNSDLNTFDKTIFTINRTDFQTSLTNLKSSPNAKNGKENITAAQLPVISSVFSIPSNLFERSDISLTQQVPAEFTELNDCTYEEKHLVTVPNQKLDTFQNKTNINTNRLDLNVVHSTTKRASTCISPRKQKSEKRLLPRSSPKNSLFRITESSSKNIQNDFENHTDKNSLNNKRQKTESVKSDNLTNMETSRTQVCFPQIPPKVLTLTGTNNVAATNIAPVYWIVPQNTQSVQNKNSDVLMILNNDNQTLNNANFKMPTSFINSNISNNTTIPNITSQVSKGNNQISSALFQHIPLNTVTVINTESTAGLTEISNSMKSDILNDSKIQSVSNNSLNTQMAANIEANQIKLISVSMPQNLLQVNNGNIYTISMVASSIASTGTSQNSTSVPSKSLCIQNVNPQINQTTLTGLLKHNSLNTAQQKSNKLMPSVLLPIQPATQVSQLKFRPIKSIPLGEDKNAIQQIRIPVKIADIKSSLTANNNSLGSASTLNSQNLKLASVAPNIVSQVNPMQIVTPTIHCKNKTYDFIPFKPKTDPVVVKKHPITNETEVESKNNFFDMQTLKPINVNMKPTEFRETPISTCLPQEVILNNLVGTSVSETHNLDSKESTLPLKVMSNNELACKIATNGSQKSTLATLQELFPPPVSMIPVCVMQTVHTTNKPAVTKVVVLQNTNTSETQISKTKSQRKIEPNKTTIRTKKFGRKTVRELLQERSHNPSSSEVPQSHVSTKILKPIYKLGRNGALLPPDLPSFANKFPTFSNSQLIRGMKKGIESNPNKRPNIMILPSAAKTAHTAMFSKDNSETDHQKEFLSAEISQNYQCNSQLDKIPSDFLLDKMVASKEHRPKYYDMSELRIGYFKVEDDVDSYGRFRSKFKVLFKKSLFVYDFPVTKCNQIDLSNDCSYEETVRIEVLFHTVLSMDMHNRYILIQVNKSPHVFLKNTEEDSAFISDLKTKNKIIEGILDSLQNSPIHKIILRKRQADHLKFNLCQFDSKFLVLCNVESNSLSTFNDACSCDEETASPPLKKTYQKNKRNVIRRLPQWDSERIVEPLELLNTDHLVSSNHVCSCRISCRSLRCSCVKAAKSCGTSGAVCLCKSCDNPLNILQSFGINDEYSLNDCCLFQNIYQIPKLHNFLQRTVKLNCCNTAARIVDCIPGTVLCPNTECNAQLEFSWCGVVICYPERNPRNHCSYCGQCYFTNGRHCSICNRCYIVTPKYPECPHCRGNVFMRNPIYQNYQIDSSEFDSAKFPESSSVKKISKPEIIVLDGPSSENNASEDELEKRNNNKQIENKECMYLNEDVLVDKDDKDCTFSAFKETLSDVSQESELKIEVCDKFDYFEDDDKSYPNKFTEEGKYELKLEEFSDIPKSDYKKTATPLEMKVHVVTKIDVSSPYAHNIQVKEEK